MTEPNDFDPIAASLRRQFSPPSMASLEDRIAAEAAAMEEGEPVANVPEPAEVETGSPARAEWIVAAAFFAAAALVLLVLRPWSEEASSSTPSPSVTERDDEVVIVPPTMSERAGHQLDGFLSRGDSMPNDAECEEPEERCEIEAGYPHLPPDASVRQVGECGGRTGTMCSDVDLPADRALLVQLSTGEQAIVCIERPWTDPKPQLPPGSGYNIFRRELGDYILYEITPRDAPEAATLVRL